MEEDKDNYCPKCGELNYFWLTDTMRYCDYCDPIHKLLNFEPSNMKFTNIYIMSEYLKLSIKGIDPNPLEPLIDLVDMNISSVIKFEGYFNAMREFDWRLLK